MPRILAKGALPFDERLRTAFATGTVTTGQLKLVRRGAFARLSGKRAASLVIVGGAVLIVLELST